MTTTHPHADDPTVVDFLENVFTAEVPEDLNGEPLGTVRAFGYVLTPDQVEAIAEGLRYQARIAREAVSAPAPVLTRSLDTGESAEAVRDLRPGDLVDLEADHVADPDGDDVEAEFEYFAVDTVTNGEREGQAITAVEFTNGAYVVFPADHKVIVYRPV